jgi:hypothetical protein
MIEEDRNNAKNNILFMIISLIDYEANIRHLYEMLYTINYVFLE